jgi:hypothetical protein
MKFVHHILIDFCKKLININESTFLFLKYMLSLFILIPIFFLCFFNIVCFVGMPFYFMMEFFSGFFGKKFANLDKKVIGILSFAMSALIYSLGLAILMATLLMSAESSLNPLFFFRLWSIIVLLGLMVSIPFYSILWCFLRTFKKIFPNQCNDLNGSGKTFFISFTITALIFFFVFGCFFYYFATWLD